MSDPTQHLFHKNPGPKLVLAALFLLSVGAVIGVFGANTIGGPSPEEKRQACLWEAVEAYPTTHPDKLKTMTSDLDACKDLSSKDKTQVKKTFNDMAARFVENLASLPTDESSLNPSGQGEAHN